MTAAQMAVLDGRQELYCALARRFSADGVAAFLWRDRDAFPMLAGFDMDVLVAPRDWRRANQLVADIAGAFGWRAIMRVRRGHLHTWILRGPGGPFSDRNTLQVDLHRALTVRGVPYLDLKSVAMRSERVAGAQFLPQTEAAAISCLEPLLAGKTPKPRYVQALAAADKTRLAELLRESLGDPKTFAVAAPSLWRIMALQALRCRPLACLCVLAWKLADATISYARPTGKMIALSGPDGAGKSSIIDALCARAPRRAAMAVKVFHSRPFLVPRLASLMPRKVGAKILSTRAYEPNLSWWKTLLRTAILMLDCNLGYWLKVRPLQARGHMVVFDRYMLDLRIDARLRGLALPDAALKLLGWLTPKPDLTAVVVANPQTILARKQELTLEEACDQTDRYRALARDTRALLLESDTLSPADLAASLTMECTP